MGTKKRKILEIIVNAVFGLSLISFFAAFNFQDNLINGWYQQYLPSGINNNINDLVFTDSLTGYISTANDSYGVNYLLKTTNGGDNWFSVLRDTTGRINNYFHFFNKDTAYLMRSDEIIKTTNQGMNWVHQCYLPGVTAYYAINLDTIFCISDISIIGGLWRTTNGGTSWNLLVNFGSCNPEKIYFFNKYNGYMAKCNELWKSTDCGANWFYLAGGNWLDIHFLDSLTGYKADGGIRKTTDGGNNWIQQQLPITFQPGMGALIPINYDTIWGVGDLINNNGLNAIIYKTTNGGVNWGYQQPLYNNTIYFYNTIAFKDRIKGWAYKGNMTGVHTKVGGNDTTIIQIIYNNNSVIPNDFILEQNYPNPFNSKSNIKYKISKSTDIKIKIFDIQGKEIETLIDKKQNRGDYQLIFDGTDLSSGIYIYSLYADGYRVDTKKMILLK